MSNIIDLESALRKASSGETFSLNEIVWLLTYPGKEITERLCEAARTLRQRYFGAGIFLYGFIYISTYCRNNCTFCLYRCGNLASRRYRKGPDEVISAALDLAASGVHLIDLTMGEDPYFFDDNGNKFPELVDLVRSVGQKTKLPIMISPGVAPDQVIGDLADAGATWYACYQETHSQKLFRQLRPRQDYAERIKKKLSAHEKGLLIEEGVLVGVGENPSDLAKSISMMRLLDADQVRAMRFIPQTGVPLENAAASVSDFEQRFLAVLRIVFPERLIPASLDIDGLAGLRPRLNAGANVVTSLVPPGCGLAGVAQSSLDIDNARRTTYRVGEILADCGLNTATIDEYRQWIDSRRVRLGYTTTARDIHCGLQ